LEQNYRSTKNILLASDEVIANNTSRKEKTLWTENEEGDPIYLVETTDERGEAVSVVKEMKKLRQRGVRLSEMAIFYRTNAQSRIFEDELRKESIPYIIYGGVKFYDRQEIKNVIAYLNLANNPADNTSLKRIINVPARGIGKTTVEKLEAEAINAGVGMLEYIRRGAFGDNFNAGTRSRLTSFLKLINELAGMKDQRLPDFVSEAIKKTLYIEALTAEKTEEALERIANIDELISAVAEAFRQTPELTLSEFLDQVALVSDIDRYDDAEDVLPMMTMHLAKGLEFATVFIVGLEEGLLPHIRSIDEPSEIEEERRLFYVGMTRAKKTLYICHARERMVRGSYTYNVPSRFLEEVPGKLVQRLNEAPKRPEFNIFRPRRQESAGASSFDSEFCQIQSGNFAEFADESAGPMYKVGQRVRHPTFGEGIIRRTEGKPGQQKLLVQFKSGDLKNLSANHANLAML
jgi:DNA helicase-2/ATP-dependent DNA helicase PcrA